MLTESEKEWLKERVLLPCYFCKYCTGYHNQSCNAFEPLSSCWNRLCENFDFEYFDEEVFLDAAEFESRVAAKLADITFCTFRDINGLRFECLPEIRLKYARLSVEEEMDE